MFLCIFYHVNVKNKFIVGHIHSNIEHKLYTIMMVMMGVVRIAAKYCAEGRIYCYSKNLPCSVGCPACYETICLRRHWG